MKARWMGDGGGKVHGNIKMRERERGGMHEQSEKKYFWGLKEKFFSWKIFFSSRYHFAFMSLEEKKVFALFPVTLNLNFTVSCGWLVLLFLPAFFLCCTDWFVQKFANNFFFVEKSFLCMNSLVNAGASPGTINNNSENSIIKKCALSFTASVV